MSSSDDRERRSKRFSRSKNKGIKRYKFAKQADPLGCTVDLTRRFEDRSWYTCGNSNCAMCGNPRKFFGEMTLKEKSDIEVNLLPEE